MGLEPKAGGVVTHQEQAAEGEVPRKVGGLHQGRPCGPRAPHLASQKEKAARE